MTFARIVLRRLYPDIEAQRMELREAILRAQAITEDIRRTLKKANGEYKPDRKG